MNRALIVGALLLLLTGSASAQHFLRGPKYYSGHNPPVRFDSGAYGGYAGSAYYLSPKIYPSPFPGYHWADPTLQSTGPGAAFASGTGNFFYGSGNGSPQELMRSQPVMPFTPVVTTGGAK